MGRTLNEDDVLKEIDRWIGYLDEDMITRIKIGIKKLQPAQPEQVYVANVTLTDEQVKEAVEKVKSAVISVIKPDRKIGKWQKLYGHVIPGRSPVWCCSECGKGIHVFGIEPDSYNENIADHQWLSCPNCDAKMIGEEE